MKLVTHCLAAAAMLGLSAPAFAAMPAEVPTERSQIAQSDLVFVGTVDRVEYKQSGQKGDPSRVPHTFVTYNVEKVLHGSADKQVTLRFVGGRGEKARFLNISGFPMFDKGDQDLLMVAENTSSSCPLVGCASGRYRFIQGRVFSESGQAIEQDSKGELTKVGYYNLPEVMTHKVSNTVMTLVDHFDAGEDRVELNEAGRGAHLTTEQFIQRVDTISREVGKATPAIFKNANINVSFDFSFEVSAAPVERHADHEAETPKTEQERAELAATQANGGNPAIGEFKGAKQ